MHMDTRIKECLAGQDPNHLFAFFVLRRLCEDQTKEVLAEELDAVVKSGCGGIYIETQYDDTWGDEEWFELMGFVLEECKKRNLRVWLLDDQSPPSGRAKHAITRKYPHLRRKLVVQDTVDIIGPQQGACIPLDLHLQEDDQLQAIIAWRVEGTNAAPEYVQGVNLTDHVHNGLLIWDAPEGFWRVFIIFRSEHHTFDWRESFVDVMNPESCQLMISEVYQPHYDRFSEYFGNTLAAFFTDEPMIGNMAEDVYRFDEKLGERKLVIPWREDLVAMIAKAEGWTEAETWLAMPGLWWDIGGKTPLLRRRYMDILSRCYSENFIQPLGRWCKEHGIMHTGHIIEDENGHFRFGWSAAHFFRAMEGQHTAGIDLVQQQLRIGSRDISHSTFTGTSFYDSWLYLYTVTRLGTSLAQLYPQMEGRLMCENAGSSGWAEGLPGRKYMIDAMLMAGSNLYSPALFSPIHKVNTLGPHVYSHGTNPQFPFQKNLMQYTNRMCHLLTGGVHKANALVYYPAEADWAGDCAPIQNTAAALIQAHIDLEFAPWDLLGTDKLTLRDGKLHIHKSSFDALVVPCCQYLPEEILRRFDEIAQQVPVIFEDSLPTVSQTHQVFAPKHAHCMPASEVPGWFQAQGFVDYKLEGNKDLMHLHMSEGKTETYLFFNISPNRSADEMVEFPYTGSYVIYDAWNNTCIRRETADGMVRLRIPARSIQVLIFGSDLEQNCPDILPAELDDLVWKPLDENTPVRVKMHNWETDTPYAPVDTTVSGLGNLAPENPTFSGTVKYELTVTTQEAAEYLDLGTVGEVAEVTVNGLCCGQLVALPFRFRVKEAWQPGENKVEILVATCCAYAKKNFCSKTISFSPMGLLGPVKLA